MPLASIVKGLREGGVYKTGDGTVVVVCPDDASGHVIYVLEEAGPTEPAGGESGVNRRKFELFRADEQGRLYRFGRATGWRVADLDLEDTGQTVRAC